MKMLKPTMPATINIRTLSNPMTLTKVLFGVNLINAAIPRPDITMVNSAANKPINKGTGIFASPPHSKVWAKIRH